MKWPTNEIIGSDTFSVKSKPVDHSSEENTKYEKLKWNPSLYL